MAGQSTPAFSPLTGRVFDDHKDLDERLRAAAGGLSSLGGFVDIPASRSWPALLNLLQRVTDEKLPALVYGDYDVDGSFSAFLMFRWLRANGVPGNSFLPSRFKHGYGLDETIIKQAHSQGYKALIALDCGTANLDEIALARELGLEVAVIDHHQPGEDLPEAVILNPHLEDCLPPLCTAGLVCMVLQALYAEGFAVRFGDEFDLAGLATIADVVPLVTANWLLAHEALINLPGTTNFGISEVLKSSGLHGLTRLTSQQLAFNVIPRLNAAGRMRSAKMVLDLLDAADEAAAKPMAAALDALNRERRDVGESNSRKALLQSTHYENAGGLVLYSPDWHIGVLGIVAAKVAEQTQKPSIVLTDAPSGEGLLTGSARSVNGFDLMKALSTCTTDSLSFGGHAQAAGIKLLSGDLEAFRSEWGQSVVSESFIDGDSAPEEHRAHLHDLTEQFEADMWRLAPFGPGHCAPMIRLEGCHVHRCDYMGKDKTHIRVVVTDGERQAKLVGFRMSHLYNRLQPGAKVEPLIEVDTDNYNNQRSLQLRLYGLSEGNGSKGSSN